MYTLKPSVIVIRTQLPPVPSKTSRRQTVVPIIEAEAILGNSVDLENKGMYVWTISFIMNKQAKLHSPSGQITRNYPYPREAHNHAIRMLSLDSIQR